MEEPPKRMSSSTSVRVFSPCKLLAAMAEEEADFARDVNPPRLYTGTADDDDGGANASVLDRLDEATSARKAVKARRDGIILIGAMVHILIEFRVQIEGNG